MSDDDLARLQAEIQKNKNIRQRRTPIRFHGAGQIKTLSQLDSALSSIADLGDLDDLTRAAIVAGLCMMYKGWSRKASEDAANLILSGEKLARELSREVTDAVRSKGKETRMSKEVSKEVAAIFAAVEARQDLDERSAQLVGGDDEPKGELDPATMALKRPPKTQPRRGAETHRLPVTSREETTPTPRDTDGETFQLPVIERRS